MNLLIKFLLFGILMMFTVYASADRPNPENCDHDEPDEFVVEVIIDKQSPKKKAQVKPKAIVVCHKDTIIFERGSGSAQQEFSVEFVRGNAYLNDFTSNRGRSSQQVMADPGAGRKPVFLKYNVKVNGRPDLDPRIIITPH